LHRFGGGNEMFILMRGGGGVVEGIITVFNVKDDE
jgi:hypothetical protein